WTCDLSGDGEFKVKVIRNFIDDLFLPSSDVATRWVKFIPIKVNVFSWRARRDRLPTRVNLSRRGVLLDSHLCPLCNAAMEDVQHVFFRCDVARVVLRKICRWWDLDWQEICSFSDWDAWFLSFRLSSRLKSILEGVFYVAWWRIWRLRNQLVFDASPPNRSTIFDDIVKRILLDVKLVGMLADLRSSFEDSFFGDYIIGVLFRLCDVTRLDLAQVPYLLSEDVVALCFNAFSILYIVILCYDDQSLRHDSSFRLSRGVTG
ncbi:RNA-directed DNA polymerase, eukaryota, partial [Tanacetum coccineum]